MNTQHDVIDLKELAALIDAKQPTCICGLKLTGAGLSHYVPHDGGYWVQGLPVKAWIYVHCQCGHDMALWKIVRELKQ